MLNISCFKCSSKDYFLQRKGHNVGAYCSDCGSWIKWVGKADVKKWTIRGKVVLDERAMVSVNISKEKTNIGVDSKEDEDIINSLVNNNVSKQVDGCGALKVNPFDKREKGNVEKSFTCNVCKHGELLPISGSSVEVRIVIYEGVLSVYDNENGNSLGNFKLDYCPGCGVKLS